MSNACNNKLDAYLVNKARSKDLLLHLQCRIYNVGNGTCAGSTSRAGKHHVEPYVRQYGTSASYLLIMLRRYAWRDSLRLAEDVFASERPDDQRTQRPMHLRIALFEKIKRKTTYVNVVNRGYSGTLVVERSRARRDRNRYLVYARKCPDSLSSA